MQPKQIEKLSDDALIANLRSACAKSNELNMHIIRLLMEAEERRIYLADACSSMFDYCVRRLNMSEGMAYLRLAAARLVRQFPQLARRVESGEIHLSSLIRLRGHLTPENVDEIAEAVRGMSKRRVAEFLASRECKGTQPPAPTRLRKLPKSQTANAIAPAPERDIELVCDMLYRLGLTLSREERDELLSVRDLMMHRNPSGDLKAVVMTSIREMRARLEREIHATTARPRAPSLAKTKGISRHVRREVFARDGHRCTYENKKGQRCPATAPLELHHIVSPLHGGSNEAENVCVRCRAHNLWHAENDFGKQYVRGKIHSSQLKSRVKRAKARQGTQRDDVPVKKLSSG